MIPNIATTPRLPERTFPIAIIGTGGIVKDAHLPAYRKAGFPVWGIIVTQEPFNTPAADGRVTFTALEADVHGHHGTIELRNSGPDAYLTDWRDPRWRLEYTLKTPAATKWVVTAEVAAPAATSLVLAVGKTETPAPVAATGPGLTWATVTLGTIQLPAGEARFDLRGPATGWKPLSIRHVWLTPATP